MTADLERAILARAYARLSCVLEYRIEHRTELNGQRRRRPGVPARVESVVLVAGRPSLLDELAPFAPREQLRSALDVARAADLRELFELVDSGDIQLLRIRARIACMVESYARPPYLDNDGELVLGFRHPGRSIGGGRP